MLSSRPTDRWWPTVAAPTVSLRMRRRNQHDDHHQPGRRAISKAIEEEYTEVAACPTKGFPFHTGRPLTHKLGYDPAEVEALPDQVVESFAGVANPFAAGRLPTDARVVEVGSGAGLDAILAARRVGVYRLWQDSGSAIGAVLDRVVADLLGLAGAILAVGLLAFVSGGIVRRLMYETPPTKARSSA